MNDLIERQSAIDIVEFECGEWRGLAGTIVKAIEQLPSAQPATNCSEIPNKSDTISRQAAIDALDCINGVEEVLRSLPSAQPDHNADIGKKAEGDCISRKTALDALAKQMPRSYTPDGSHPADEEIYKAQEIYVDCIESIEILPAVQPEIIRCKDCKFAHITNDRRYCKFCDMFTDDYGQLIEMYFDSNFYCGYAERRIDGQSKSD